jgi:hypothetical protein
MLAMRTLFAVVLVTLLGAHAHATSETKSARAPMGRLIEVTIAEDRAGEPRRADRLILLVSTDGGGAKAATEFGDLRYSVGARIDPQAAGPGFVLELTLWRTRGTPGVADLHVLARIPIASGERKVVLKRARNATPGIEVAVTMD